MSPERAIEQIASPTLEMPSELRSIAKEWAGMRQQAFGDAHNTYTIATAPAGSVTYSGPSLMTLTTSGTNQ